MPIAKAGSLHAVLGQGTLVTPEQKLSLYDHYERAVRVYSHWMSGYLTEEIAEILQVPLDEVEKDVRAVHLSLPPTLIVQHHNDRNRILVQRHQSDQYRGMLGDSLQTPVTTMLAAGISPAGIMREFREATGMMPARGPTVQFNTQNLFGSGTGPQNAAGITSAEDMIRKVIAGLGEDEPLSGDLTAEDEIPLTAEAEDPSDDPDSDDDEDVETDPDDDE